MKILPLLFCGMLIFSRATAGDYTVDSTAANRVTFFAKATLGAFTGTTGRVYGTVEWNRQDSRSNRVYLEVDLGSLDTGSGKRNKHMREKYLETGKFPVAVFEGVFSPDSVISDSLTRVQVRGRLTIHGITQPLNIKAKLITTDRNIRVLAAFPVNIRDFGIKKPRFLFVSMNEKVRVQLDFFLRPRE